MFIEWGVIALYATLLKDRHRCSPAARSRRALLAGRQNYSGESASDVPHSQSALGKARTGEGVHGTKADTGVSLTAGVFITLVDRPDRVTHRRRVRLGWIENPEPPPPMDNSTG